MAWGMDSDPEFPSLTGKRRNFDDIEWDTRFVLLAQHLAEWSPLRGTKVGAVIVDSDNEIRAVGVSSFPRGIDSAVDAWHSRETGENKYWTCHAEQSAIHSAARFGLPLKGCRIYCSMFPCADCARAIIQSGIIEVVSPPPDTQDVKWGTHFQRSIVMLREVGIVILHWRTGEDEIAGAVMD